MRRSAAFAALLLLLGLAAGSAQAQGWGLTRERPRPTHSRPSVRPHSRTADPTARRETLIRRYRSILAARPGEAMAFAHLIRLVRERDGNLERLTSELRAEVAGEGPSYAQFFLLGRLAEESRDPAAAAVDYERARVIAGERPGPVLALARLAREAGELSRAATLIEAALPQMHDVAARRDLWRQLGELAIERGDLGAARGWYQRVMAGATAGVFSRAEYARALARHERHVEAAEAYASLAHTLRGDPRVIAPLRREQAREQLASGDAAGAIETANQLLRQVRGGERAEVLSLLEEAYRGAGRLDEFADELTRTAGRRADLWSMAGRLRDEAGDAEGGMRAYRRALALSPRALDTRERLVHALVRVGRLEDAIEEAESLVRTARGEPRYLASLIRLLVQSGRRDAALVTAARASRRGTRDANVHRALAEIYDELGEERLATAELERVLRISPRDVEALVALGTRRLGQGDRAGAAALFRRIARGRAGVEAHLELGQVFADHDLLVEAEQELRIALRLAPQRLAVIRALAAALERERETETRSARRARETESAALWGRVLELASDERSRREAREHVVLASIRRGAGREQMANWRRAFGAVPPDLEAGRFLASALLRQRPPRRDEAADVLERLVRHTPGDLVALKSLERVRTLLGDRAAAIEALRRLVAADPRRAASYLGRMSEHAHALYRDQDALRWAAEAAARAPDDAAANVRLGELLRARQDFTGATSAFEQALRVDSRLYAVRLKLAEMLLSAGRTAAADAQYIQVIRASLDDELVSLATRASMRFHLADGTLPTLEAVLLPLAVSSASRPIFRRLLVEIYDRETSPWLASLRTSGSDAAQAHIALAALGRRALSPLLEALADEDPAQRGVALRLLGHVDRPEAAAPLLALAERDGSISVRVAALVAASGVSTQHDAPRLSALLRGSESRLHPVAAFALARVGGRVALTALRENLQSPQPEVRAFALLGLGWWRDASSLDPLVQRLRMARSSSEAAVAAWSVGRLLQDPAGRVSGNRRELALAALVRRLESASLQVATSAAIAWIELDPVAAAPRLAAMLFGVHVSARRAAAMALLRDLASQSSTTAGPRMLHSPVGYPRVMEVLGRLQCAPAAVGAASSNEALVEALTVAASEALGDSPAHAEWAIRLVAAPAATLADMLPPTEHRAALVALLVSTRPQLESELLAAASSGSLEVRTVAIRALVNLPDSRVAAVAASALQDEAPEVRRAALELLGGREDAPDEVVPRVVDAFLRSSEWPERLAGVRALGRWADARSVPALIVRLEHDRYAFVREAAAQALGAFADAPGRLALERAAAGDAEPRVRAAARAALERRSTTSAPPSHRPSDSR